MAKLFTLPYTIRLADTDAAGLIYSPNLFRMCLVAFEHFLDEIGHGVATLMKKQKMGLPVVHLEGDFKRPNKIGDKIVITIRVAELGTSSVRMSYELLGEDGTCYATSSMVHVNVDPQTRRAADLLPEFREALEPYLATPETT